MLFRIKTHFLYTHDIINNISILNNCSTRSAALTYYCNKLLSVNSNDSVSEFKGWTAYHITIPR